MSGHEHVGCACELGLNLVAPYVTTLSSLSSNPEVLNRETLATGLVLLLGAIVNDDEVEFDEDDLDAALMAVALPALTEIVMRDHSVCAAIMAVCDVVRESTPLTGDDVIEGASRG